MNAKPLISRLYIQQKRAGARSWRRGASLKVCIRIYMVFIVSALKGGLPAQLIFRGDPCNLCACTFVNFGGNIKLLDVLWGFEMSIVVVRLILIFSMNSF